MKRASTPDAMTGDQPQGAAKKTPQIPTQKATRNTVDIVKYCPFESVLNMNTAADNAKPVKRTAGTKTVGAAGLGNKRETPHVDRRPKKASAEETRAAALTKAGADTEAE